MDYKHEELEQFLWNYGQICKILSPESERTPLYDFGKLDKLIHRELPELLKASAPPNAYELLADFEAEYRKFHDFFVYDALIGKNVLALGGGFSSGKSSFLNTLLEVDALPTSTDPSTSVPTYIVRDEENSVRAINVFNAQISLELPAVNMIAHGFGRVGDREDGALQMGHVLNSIFLATPYHKFENIAFLDTPGYSKPDSRDYSAKTDEQIARRQLNTADFILWFVPADTGTITREDIQFLHSLRGDIPFAVVVSKAGYLEGGALKSVTRKIKDVLAVEGLHPEGVYAHDQTKPDGFDHAELVELLNGWNRRKYEEQGFARRFKTLFLKCREYYAAQIEEDERTLSRLNKALTLSEDADVQECIRSVVKQCEADRLLWKKAREKLAELQTEFFRQIKLAADTVGIQMPEPSEIDLIQDKITNPLTVLEEYNRKRGVKPDDKLIETLRTAFSGIKPVFDRRPGGSAYADELMNVIRNSMNIKPENIRFGKSLDYSGILQENLSGAQRKNNHLRVPQEKQNGGR